MEDRGIPKKLLTITTLSIKKTENRMPTVKMERLACRSGGWNRPRMSYSMMMMMMMKS
jgi:hypothetical protein